MEEGSNNPGSFNYFEKMVEKPTWKELLLELISTNKIDPWNINISALSDAFVAHIKEMKKVDFTLEANVILAASILLKYKSDTLKTFAYPQEQIQPTLEDFVNDYDPNQVPTLTFASRIPPKRPITVTELISEMEKIIKYDSGERIKIPKGGISETVDLVLNERDIEGDIVKVYNRVQETLDSEGWALYSTLAKDMDSAAKVYLLLCLLYLAQREKIDLRQDEMFGELFIKTIKSDQGDRTIANS